MARGFCLYPTCDYMGCRAPKDVIWITLELEGGFGCKGDGERAVLAFYIPPFAKSAKDGAPGGIGLLKGEPLALDRIFLEYI